MPAAVFEPVEEVSMEFTPVEEVKPKAISFEPIEEVAPRKSIAQFLAEPDAGVTESSPLTPGALPAVSNNLSTAFPTTEREMIEQQVPGGVEPFRIGEQPATLPRFGKEGTVSRGVSDVISGLGEWALNKPEEFAATFTPLAPAIALRYAPEIAQQFAGDVVEGAKGDRQALGRALAMAGLVGIPKGAEVARERWLLGGKAREAVPTPDEAARAGMRPEQPGEPMVRPPQEPLPAKPAPIDFVPEAVVEQPALAKITEEMNAAVDEAAKAGPELPVQHDVVLPGASETFKEITGEEPTTKGAENASSQQSAATLHGDVLRVGESARRENEAGLPVNEGGEGIRGNEVQEPAVARSEESVTPTQAPRDWDSYYENLVGDLDSFRPARETGRQNYEMDDVAQRFVDYAKADTSGKPLNELVMDFAKADEATPTQIRKLRASVKNLEETEATKPSVAEPEAPAKTKTPSEEPTPEFPRRFVWPGHEALVSKDLATGKWRVTEFEVGESGELKPLRHDLFNSYNEAVIDQASNANRREVALDTQAGTPAGVESGPGLVGMGGAVPGEFGPGSVSSIMFAAIDKDLAEMGKPPMKRGEPRTWDQDMQIATARMNRDPQWIPNLIAEVKDHPRPLASWETMGMNLQEAYWRAQANDALKRIAQASEDGNQPELVRAKQDAARFEDNILDLYDAVGRGGTGSEAGRTLNAQKIGLTDDLSLVEMRLQARARTKDGKLTPEIEKEVERIHKEYQEKLSKLEKATAEADKRRIDAETRATLAEIARQTAEKQIPPPHIQKLIKSFVDEVHARGNAARERLRGKLFTISPEMMKDIAEVGMDNILTVGEDFGRWSVKMVEDIGEHVRPYLVAIFEASKKLYDDTWKGKTGQKTGKQLPPKVIELAKQTIKKGDSTVQQREKLTARIADRYQNGELDKITPAVQKLARTFIQDGIRDREELIDAVHEVIGKKIPEWTRRDTMDAISGYGDYKSLSKDQISVVLRDLKGQMQQIAKLEDMASGQAPLRSGLERREVTEAQSKLIKLVNEAKRKGGYETTDPTKQLRTALDEVKKRTASQIAEYERRIAENDFSVRKLSPIEPDAELLKQRADMKRVRQEWEQKKRDWELANRQGWQRWLDRFVRWERAFKLSSPVVFGKLAAAAITRVAETATTETAGKVIRNIPGIKQVAKQAPREGAGLNVKATAKALRAAISKGMDDAAQTLKKGAADIDVEFGDKIVDRDWVNFFGQLHGMMKAPVKRAEFEYSLQQRIEHAIKSGLDPSNPMVMQRLCSEALSDGYRSIFMQRGFFSDWFNSAVRMAEQSKKYPVAGEVSARVARFLLPIVRVPMNIVAETATGVYGLPFASLRTMTHAIQGSLKNLDPVVADSIMRQFKKGSIGLGLMAIGYFFPESVGGYYAREERKKSDPKFGGFKVGGVDVPRWMTHAPWFELMQMGATIRRTEERHVTKRSRETLGPSEGLWAAGLGLIEETPFVGQMLRVDKIFESPAERTRYFGELARSTIVPQLLTKAAEIQDSEGLLSDATKRAPKTVWQHIEMGIPGLRQNVPVKRERRP